VVFIQQFSLKLIGGEEQLEFPFKLSLTIDVNFWTVDRDMCREGMYFMSYELVLLL